MDPTRGGVRAGRAVIGALGLFALIGTLVGSNDKPGFTAANFFSYFTVESNVLAAVVMLGLAAVPTAALATEGLRGATTLYIVITGVVYNLMLRGIDVGIEPTVLGHTCNELLHLIVPILVLLDWLLVPPLRTLPRSRAVLFLLFPLVYLGYSLARGEITGWYPYPFLNAETKGYFHVLLTCVVLALMMLLLSLAVVEIGRRRAASVRGPGPAPDPDPRLGGRDPL
ncbi:Pr6Pr family membrane protein [Jatrophihabitans sp. YIM 134969]